MRKVDLTDFLFWVGTKPRVGKPRVGSGSGFGGPGGGFGGPGCGFPDSSKIHGEAQATTRTTRTTITTTKTTTRITRGLPSRGWSPTSI